MTPNACDPRECWPFDVGHPHLIGGEFQSDKYPTCPRGKVPLSVKDPTAQDLLWEYAQRRRPVDAEFATDLETALRTKGYEPPTPSSCVTDQERAYELVKTIAIRGGTAPRHLDKDMIADALAQVRRDTIEECAKVCEAKRIDYGDYEIPLESTRRWNACVSDCAAAVRTLPFTRAEPGSKP